MNNKTIKVINDDITTLKVDAIVNAANTSLLGGGGVDGAIHFAAGPELLKECIKLNGCKVGEAKITKGYKLKAKFIIHTVGPVFYSYKDPSIYLKNCYLNSLNLAKKEGIHSIAFPNISTGVYGYPKNKACKVALETVKKWIDENKDYEIQIIFCCFDIENYSIYLKEINEK